MRWYHTSRDASNDCSAIVQTRFSWLSGTINPSKILASTYAVVNTTRYISRTIFGLLVDTDTLVDTHTRRKQYQLSLSRLVINAALFSSYTSSSSRMRVIYHNWSATKQRPHPQSVAEISHHSVLSGDRIRQCETSSGSRHKDTDQCL